MATKPEDEWELVLIKSKERRQLSMCMAVENCSYAKHGVNIASEQRSGTKCYNAFVYTAQGQKHENS